MAALLRKLFGIGDPLPPSVAVSVPPEWVLGGVGTARSV